VRGRRPCPLRAAREAALRNRLASVSALFAKIGVKPVAVRASSLELADTAANHGLWTVPTKYLRGRLERKLATAHQRATARARNLPYAIGAAVTRLWGMPLRMLQQALPHALLGSIAGQSSSSSNIDSSTARAASQTAASNSSTSTSNEPTSSSYTETSIEAAPHPKKVKPTTKLGRWQHGAKSLSMFWWRAGGKTMASSTTFSSFTRCSGQGVCACLAVKKHS